jgi:hypothetical protein
MKVRWGFPARDSLLLREDVTMTGERSNAVNSHKSIQCGKSGTRERSRWEIVTRESPIPLSWHPSYPSELKPLSLFLASFNHKWDVKKTKKRSNHEAISWNGLSRCSDFGPSCKMSRRKSDRSPFESRRTTPLQPKNSVWKLKPKKWPNSMPNFWLLLVRSTSLSLG